jgi:hypothetical protein
MSDQRAALESFLASTILVNDDQRVAISHRFSNSGNDIPGFSI